MASPTSCGSAEPYSDSDELGESGYVRIKVMRRMVCLAGGIYPAAMSLELIDNDNSVRSFQHFYTVLPLFREGLKLIWHSETAETRSVTSTCTADVSEPKHAEQKH
jgi:hypothetical protein